MFPVLGFQIIIESGSPEDFHFMEVKSYQDTTKCDGFLSKSKE
jgi:hypothetical protein